MSTSRLVESGLLRRNVALAPMTTYRLGGDAAWFAEPSNEAELAAVLEAAREMSSRVVVLGRGSNVVVADAGVDALVIHLVGAFGDVIVGDDGVVAAGGGAQLAKVARTSVEADRGGLEFLVGIPGSVGGAVRMNAGCLGTETADVVIDVQIVNAETGESAVRSPSDLAMAYRSSNVAGHEIVVSARFATQPQPAEAGLARIREVTRWRRETQPGGDAQCGERVQEPTRRCGGSHHRFPRAQRAPLRRRRGVEQTCELLRSRPGHYGPGHPRPRRCRPSSGGGCNRDRSRG